MGGPRPLPYGPRRVDVLGQYQQPVRARLVEPCEGLVEGGQRGVLGPAERVGGVLAGSGTRHQDHGIRWPVARFVRPDTRVGELRGEPGDVRGVRTGQQHRTHGSRRLPGQRGVLPQDPVQQRARGRIGPVPAALVRVGGQGNPPVFRVERRTVQRYAV
ncbi:hypothetical protein SGRI78S_02941 [Streptomyces griseus subsp. griseus]